MTARERVLASRLIQKVDINESYARKIGLNCTMLTAESNKNDKKSIQKTERENSNQGRKNYEDCRRLYQKDGRQ